MRKALIVGVNYYEYVPPLHGCVDDARSVQGALARNGDDGSPNFATELLAGTGPADPVCRTLLRHRIEDLFSADPDIALFYFAGHGHLESTGGYILASDSKSGDDGIPMNDILFLANKSRAKSKVIVLDSCHSGITGSTPGAPTRSELSDGITILTSSTGEQAAREGSRGGIFTRLFVGALGTPGNLVGDVTPGSIYAYIDQALGPWGQRPVFKTNVNRFISLRRVQPSIARADLHRITELFPREGFVLKLDPSFEPERSASTAEFTPPDPLNTEKFAVLQRYNRVNLVVPVGAPHMWHAAMQSRACKLTVLGEYYRQLVQEGRI
jgi:hypothetical protein